MLEEFPETVKQMESKGLKYSFTAHSKNDTSSMRGRGWEDAFGTSDPAEAERRYALHLFHRVCYSPFFFIIKIPKYECQIPISTQVIFVLYENFCDKCFYLITEDLNKILGEILVSLLR